MLSKQQQKFLLELLWNFEHGIKTIRSIVIKKPIFSNDNDFYHQIKELIKMGYVDNKTYELNKTEYRLTELGWCVSNIIGEQFNNEDKYKKISQKMVFLFR